MFLRQGTAARVRDRVSLSRVVRYGKIPADKHDIYPNGWRAHVDGIGKVSPCLGPCSENFGVKQVDENVTSVHREYFLLPGLLWKWATVYNDTAIPREDSFYWRKFLDGMKYREAVVLLVSIKGGVHQISQALLKLPGREFWAKNHKIGFRISLESSHQGGFSGSASTCDLGTFEYVILSWNKMCNL